MFWNTEFLNSTPSNIDNLLQKEDVKLRDILFEDDLLQELKTSNYGLINFLNKHEIINELVENISQLTEKDCCDKLVYSRVHVAYISCEILTGGSSEIISTLMADSESLNKILTCLTKQQKVVPQKATLVSKLIATIHSMAAANLSCHITQDIDSFSNLINLLVSNIEVSGSFEILSTFIKRTDQSELRFAFCEILSKLNFVNSLIDVMTLSEVEDKQRNACQLLCDIIVIGRQEASEQTNSEPIAQDMLAEYLESTPAVRLILNQMFEDDTMNSTAIICGMKLLQTLFENKQTTNGGPVTIMRKKIEQTQEEIEKHLFKFHELLLNPPKQEPIRTTFGIIQKPLGYMRLEVVTLFRALIGTNLPNIIRKMVELNTMKVIVELFIEYCWNNLLHTQVEQALCLIINNYRNDEELNYAIDMNNQQVEQPAIEIPSRALLSQLLNECDVIGRLLLPNSSSSCNNNINNNNINTINNNNHNNGKVNNNEKKDDNNDEEEKDDGEGDNDIRKDDRIDNEEEEEEDNNYGKEAKDNKCEDENNKTINKKTKNSQNNGKTNNMTTTNNAQANFGHIIKMINSIAINSDLDTIKEHLNEMKDKRPELYDRWSTFVNVDVASFKEISLYFDAQSANNNMNHNYHNNQNNNQQSCMMNNHHQNNLTQPDDDNNDINEAKEDAHQYFAYFSFTKENVLPSINVDVLPKMRRV